MKKISSLFLLTSLLLPISSFARLPLPSSVGEEPQQKEVIRRTITRDSLHTSTSTAHVRTASSTRESGFCTQIDKILVQVGNGGLTSGEKRVENIAKREEKQEDVRTQIDIKREENNTKRKTQLEELTKRATTDEQKTAVLAFTSTVEKALTERKSATDALITAHRKEVDQMIATRKVTIEKALAILKAAIETAKTKAKSDCIGGVAGETVRSTLKDSIQKAQQTFRTTIESLQKDTDISQKDTKKQELKKIEETFKKSVEQAKNNLKASFKEKRGTAATTAN